MCTRLQVPVSLQHSFSAVPVHWRVVVGTWQFHVYQRVQAWNAKKCMRGQLLSPPSVPCMWFHLYRVPPSAHPSLLSVTCGTMSEGSSRLPLGINHSFGMLCRPSTTSAGCLPRRTPRHRLNGSCRPCGGMLERHVPERGFRNRKLHLNGRVSLSGTCLDRHGAGTLMPHSHCNCPLPSSKHAFY